MLTLAAAEVKARRSPPPAENLEVASLLERIAQLLTAQQASPFRARAYREAASEIRRLRQPLRRIWQTGGVAGLDALPGVGPSIASVLHEFLLTGHVLLLSRLEGRLAPEDLFVTLPGIGEALARRLHERLGVETLEELELAAHDGRLGRVPGFGPRRTRALRDLLAARLSRSLRSQVLAPAAAPGVPAAPLALPDVAGLLAVDASYRERAARGELPQIAPHRFNPLGEAWLPILHTERAGWHLTALYSNSARAHELHRTRDWVVIYYARGGQEGQCTVVTEWRGALAGRRVVRGREPECSEHYGVTSPGALPDPDDEREPAVERDSRDTVQALGNAAGHPQDAGPIETIETHLSWVFLTRDHAYKLKKPVRNAHFDYTTAEARRIACERELRLNRRLAASVYLDVVPVRRDDSGRHVGGNGEVIDWLVRMRRLPRDLMLDACIERRDVSESQLDALARVLSVFYRQTPGAGLSGAEYRQKLAAELESQYRSLQRSRHDLDPDGAGSIFAGQMRWIEENASCLDARAPLVREAHGDLRPEHICLETEPVIIDCLDFALALRLLDPLSELAFLELECQRLGDDRFGLELVQRCSRRSGDEGTPELLAFYRRYHALVRAGLAAARLAEPGADVHKWQTRAQAYLRLARSSC